MKQFKNRAELNEATTRFSEDQHGKNQGIDIFFNMFADSADFTAYLVSAGYDIENLTADGSEYDLGGMENV